MTTHCIAFWNVENLFDVEDWADRPAWLQKTLKSELQGWTQAILDRKLDRLAEIIGLIDDGRGPDAFGVCEVESDRVLNQLRDRLAGRGRHYQVAHVPGHDGRGIDVAFLFDGDRYDCEAIFSHVILKRTGTRDLFQINLKIKAADGI